MKHKIDSWTENRNSTTSESASARGVRRTLTRAGLGQLSHVVSGALSTLQGGSHAHANDPRVAAQNRMRALLNQDRALLSHRACGQASLEDSEDTDAPEIPALGSQTRGAAQNRMRELLNQDRALLALREARKRDNPETEPLDDDFAAELVQLVDREWSHADGSDHADHADHAQVASVVSSTTITSSVATSGARSSCVGVTASFVAEPAVATVCTPGPLSAAQATPMTSAAPAQRLPLPGAATLKPLSPRPVAAPAEPAVAVAEPAAGDPIRTRSMAKLLALQGYRDRALSIYDELLAVEPDNADLRAEADRLRN